MFLYIGRNEWDLVHLENSKGEKWLKHYSSNHKILLVGKGDFSFAACLGRSRGALSRMSKSIYSVDYFNLVYSPDRILDCTMMKLNSCKL